MAFFTGFAVYFVIWWVTLFIVLPHGNRSQAEDGNIVQGTDPGAPTNSNIMRKLIWNTIIAGVVYGAYWIITSWFGLGFENIPSFFGKN